MRRFLAFVAALSLLLVALPAAAQTEDSSIEISDVTVARYPRVQMVAELRNLQSFDQANLRVFENGVEVTEFEVETLENSEVRVGIVLALDVSGSMAGAPLEAAKEAASEFVRQKRPADAIALVSFGETVNVVSPFTTDGATVLNRIAGLEAAGGTALYDGALRSAQLYSGDAAALEPNIIILTDGNDTTSEATLEEALTVIDDKGARVFAVGLQQSEELNLEPLQALATTPSDLLIASSPEELAGLYDQIQREISNKLVIRFTAEQSSPGDLALGLEYSGLTADTSVQVPGFVKSTPVDAGPPPTFAPAEPFVVEGGLPVATWVFTLAIPIAVAVALVLFLLLIFRTSEDEAASLRNRLAAYGRRGEATSQRPKGILNRVPFLRSFTERAEEVARERGALSGVNAALEQANIALGPGEAIAAAIGLSVLIGLFTAILFGGLLAGVIGFLLGLVLFALLVSYFGSREKKRFENQLPDTLTLISTSLRAGYSLLQATEAVAAEAPAPTSREFGRAIAEARLGRPVVDTLQGISDRMRSEDFNWAVMAIEIQREVGGNLAEVLMIVADTMRQRNRLKGEIKALTAEGRISAIILGLMPFALFAFLFTTNREYLDPILTERVGLVALGIGIALMGVGGYWLNKIVNIEV